MNRVVHFEIPSNDPEKTLKFYQDCFGWQYTRFGQEEYWLANTGDTNTPGINGAIMKRKDPRQPVANSIEVPNIDTAMETVKKNGGQIVVPKMAIPTVGYLAYFTDPDGNIFGLWHNDANAK